MGMFVVILVPLALALFSRGKGKESLDRLHIAGYGVSAVAAAHLAWRVLAGGERLNYLGGLFFCDGINAFFIFTVSAVTFSAALYSAGFFAHELGRKTVTLDGVRRYYLCFDLFIFSMLTVLSVNNLGYMWIAIEMTTLVSAFLVGFHKTKEAVEAAWKYIIICTVGIVIALIGTILFYYAVARSGCPKSLNWTDMIACSGKLDPGLLRIAFAFILVGYGTKAGIAPMHTWLPDAHSQAVSPISALLSGVLLKTALYAVIRYSLVLAGPGLERFSGTLFIAFGLVCLAIASGFIFVQRDLKRLLAYSSIEHVGMVCVGLGIGGPIGFAGAMLHVLGHALTKSLMFFTAGRMVAHYRTHSMAKIRGVLAGMPLCGGCFMLGGFALSGFPPFPLFVSELVILSAAFIKGAYWTAAMVMVFLCLMFAGLMFHFSRMLFGGKSAGIEVSRERPAVALALGLLLVLMFAVAFAVPLLIDTGMAGRLAWIR